jgi:hypothetical protein
VPKLICAMALTLAFPLKYFCAKFSQFTVDRIGIHSKSNILNLYMYILVLHEAQNRMGRSVLDSCNKYICHLI